MNGYVRMSRVSYAFAILPVAANIETINDTISSTAIAEDNLLCLKCLIFYFLHNKLLEITHL